MQAPIVSCFYTSNFRWKNVWISTLKWITVRHIEMIIKRMNDTFMWVACPDFGYPREMGCARNHLSISRGNGVHNAVIRAGGPRIVLYLHAYTRIIRDYVVVPHILHAATRKILGPHGLAACGPHVAPQHFTPVDHSASPPGGWDQSGSVPA